MKKYAYRTFAAAIVAVSFFIFDVAAQTTSSVPGSPAWKISSWQGGGIRGRVDSVSLDSNGNLIEKNGTLAEDRNVKKSPLLKEIRTLVLDLNLPRTKTRIVKGLGIYDGIYSAFTITLSGKEYQIEGSSFYDKRYLSLTSKQKQILTQLKEKLESVVTLSAEESVVDAHKPPPIITGNIWTVKVSSRTGSIKYDAKNKREYFVWGEKVELWTGRMTRRGQSLQFDVAWTNLKTGESFTEEIEVINAVRERVLLRRAGPAKDGLGKTFRGSYENDRPKTISGKTDLGTDWEATIDIT